MPSAFDEIRFPLEIALGSRGGPERRTDIVVTGSGREERNARWAHSRRKYDAGYGVKSFAALSLAVEFFEERRGRLTGFRFRDRLDWKSSAPNAAPGALDQVIGTGTGALAAFQLVKRYGSGPGAYQRLIRKPVAGTVLIGVNGAAKTAGTHFNADHTTGIVTFIAGQLPLAGQTVTAGFQFDVPVRFDTDFLEADLQAFEAGSIPRIPLIELVA